LKVRIFSWHTVTSDKTFADTILDFQKRPSSGFIWHDLSRLRRSRSPLRCEIGPFAAKNGSLRSPRGRLVASLTPYLQFGIPKAGPSFFKMYPCTLMPVPLRDNEALCHIDVDFFRFKSLLQREIPLNLDCCSTRISHVPFSALSCYFPFSTTRFQRKDHEEKYCCSNPCVELLKNCRILYNWAITLTVNEQIHRKWISQK